MRLALLILAALAIALAVGWVVASIGAAWLVDHWDDDSSIEGDE